MILGIIKKLYRMQFIRYIIGGGSAALIDIFLLYICTDLFGIYYLYSQIIAFVISFLFAYFFQKFLTFRDHSDNHLTQWWKFLMFALLWLALNLWIMYVCVDYFHVYYMYSAVVAKWIVFFRNYSMNKWFNFS